MIIHTRKIKYSKNYAEFFEVLVKAKEHLENKFSEVSVDLLYNLAGKRGWATVQTRYPSLADYERIDAEMDKDEVYGGLLDSIMGDSGESPEDQFYRVI